ncbi:hypothetical protein GCM10007424_02630 [Flavobacterium suaedae]|uniref:Secretion system C-terminal sorting domain-containing protein n=1 Tax=Flavobacterium suaedae TaxID=1767027 RepID=A0ABQ1JE80_9FLAO|nr:T9SS type A sorting domain-containing protein [Flavobacterium suaedae]GGB66148.1 hypothetical protein GCM10007424_02630 [Flavobacterium suaedae]
MMKRLLLGFFSLGAVLATNAQDSCTNAIEITNDEVVSVPTISGAYVVKCWHGEMTEQDPEEGTTMLRANWYSYIPSANGLLTITSVLDTNPIESTNTRLSVFTGTCENLDCYNAGENVDIQNGDYRTTTIIPVEEGVTYYIAWDNNWSDSGFDFSVSFEEKDCLSPNDFSVSPFSDFSTTSATFSWNPSITNTDTYEVEVGDAGFTPGLGEGETFYTDMASIDLSGLSITDNEVLYVYLRSNCTDNSYGRWIGPRLLYLAANTPYENGFEFGLEGFRTAITDWLLPYQAPELEVFSYEGEGLAFTKTSTTEVSDAWLYSRAFRLEAGQEVTLTFFTRLLSPPDDTVTATLDITVGTAIGSENQTNILQTITTSVEDTYTERTVYFTPTESGIYYFGFHNNSPIASYPASLLLDNISLMDTPAGTANIENSQFTVFPNPANNVVNIVNANNILVNAVEVVDLNGRTVKSVKFDGVSEAQINISELSSGVYMMNINTDNGSVIKKIVKN